MIDMKRKTILKNQLCSSIFFIVLFLIIIIPLGESAELLVDRNNADAYQSIQEAVNAASDYDIININKGLYEEAVVITKPLNLKGSDKSNTTITSFNQTALIISSENVIIEDLSFMDSSTGIMVENATDCIITDVTFQNNMYGIILDDQSSDCIIYQNNFINNTIHAVDQANMTSWSQSKKGNYWDSYQGIDNNSDGIGDTSYTIDTDSMDSYPLFKPITIAPLASFTYSPQFPTTQTLVEFSDLSDDIDGNIINWTWKIDGSIFSYEQQPIHQFSDDGSGLSQRL